MPRAGLLSSLAMETRFALLFAAISLPVLTATSLGAFYFVKERTRYYEEQNLNLAAGMLRLQVEASRNTAEFSAGAGGKSALELLESRQITAVVRDALGRDVAGTLPRSVPEEILAQSAGAGAAVEWQAGAVTYRVLAVNSRTADGTPLRLVFAQVAGAPSSVQHAYQNVLIIIALTGGMLTVTFGIMLMQSGLEPLRRLTDKARAVTASRLGDPMLTQEGIEGAPPELRELAQGLNDMLQRLQDSFRRLDEFSSDLAHELRTPIGNMLGQSEVALSRARSVEEYRAVLESNVEEFQRLSRMIQDMLFLAQSESSQQARGALTLERVDLAPQVDKVLEYYEPLLEEKNIRVRRDVGEGEGAIRANRLLLQRAIANLLSNAVRHAPAGSELAIAIIPSFEGEAGRTALRVSNAGSRIPPEELPWIFQRFFRGNESRQRLGESWGLGLAIVKAIMDMHGGEVKVHTEEGLTSFTLLFPGASKAARAPAS